jgi:hypothetical protein
MLQKYLTIYDIRGIIPLSFICYLRIANRDGSRETEGTQIYSLVKEQTYENRFRSIPKN